MAANAATEARELGARVKEGEAALTRLKALSYSPLFAPAALCSKLPWDWHPLMRAKPRSPASRHFFSPHSACAAQPVALSHATASIATACSAAEEQSVVGWPASQHQFAGSPRLACRWGEMLLLAARSLAVASCDPDPMLTSLRRRPAAKTRSVRSGRRRRRPRSSKRQRPRRRAPPARRPPRPALSRTATRCAGSSTAAAQPTPSSDLAASCSHAYHSPCIHTLDAWPVTPLAGFLFLCISSALSCGVLAACPRLQRFANLRP